MLNIIILVTIYPKYIYVLPITYINPKYKSVLIIIKLINIKLINKNNLHP